MIETKKQFRLVKKHMGSVFSWSYCRNDAAVLESYAAPVALAVLKQLEPILAQRLAVLEANILKQVQAH
jgi:hypothetical protein